jgi:hypothetical protein
VRGLSSSLDSVVPVSGSLSRMEFANERQRSMTLNRVARLYRTIIKGWLSATDRPRCAAPRRAWLLMSNGQNLPCFMGCPMKLSQTHQAEFGTTPSLEAAAKDVVQKEEQDFPLVVATMPASERQRTVALGIVIFLTIAAAVVTPFATMQVIRVDAFIPVLQTVLSAADLITAILLFAQYSIRPQLALLALACGYIFAASFAFLQTLAFPGAYATGGLIGDERNTLGWLFVLWHITFPVAILVYALSKDANRPAVLPGKSTRTTIKVTAASALAVLALQTYDPRLVADRDLARLAAKLFSSRHRQFGTIFHRLVRGSCFVVIGSCTLLTVLLTETTVLYSRLAKPSSCSDASEPTGF